MAPLDSPDHGRPPRPVVIVDRYELGPIGTNCYVVRAERGAAEAVVVDPGGNAAELRLELAGISWRTLFVPGHSPGHLAFAAGAAVFSGDVLFAGSVGRIDLPGGDWETLLASVRTLADELPPDTVVYSGHGPPTTLGQELATNPFLADLRAAS